jgi:hypothetical protein
LGVAITRQQDRLPAERVAAEGLARHCIDDCPIAAIQHREHLMTVIDVSSAGLVDQ